MGQISYLTRRGAVYYARMDVPEDLVPFLKTQTKKQSLKTTDVAVAKRLLMTVITGWQREFEELRTRRSLVAADYEHAVWDHYTDALARDDHERSNLPGEAEIDAERHRLFGMVDRGEIVATDASSVLIATLDLHVLQKMGEISSEHRKVKLADLKKHLAKGNTALIAHEVDAYLQSNRLMVEQGTPEWVSLARRMMRAEIEALERSLERDQGDFAGQPRDSLVKAPALERRGQLEVAASGESIIEAVEAFKKENPRNVSKSRIDESCRDIGIFIETVGPGFPVAKITKKHVREWKTLLMKYPLRATEVTAFRGMTIFQIVEANEELKRQVLSDRTVNRY